MNFDLNLDNYNLEDILNLFKLRIDFNEDDLKRAKKQVMMTHPDKSKMDKKYFIFFLKAFKMVMSIYNFRGRLDNKNTEYIVDKDEKKEEMLKDFMKDINFNKKFNELFEMNKLGNEEIDEGYGDWLKSDEDINNYDVKNRRDMAEVFNKKKKEMRLSIRDGGINDMENQVISGANLAGVKPNDYGSGIFGNFKYEDLKKAHVESIIPVSEEDINDKRQFNNLEEIRRFRKEEETKPCSIDESKRKLKEMNDSKIKNDMERAYKLIQQDKKSDMVNAEWMKNFKRIK